MSGVGLDCVTDGILARAVVNFSRELCQARLQCSRVPVPAVYEEVVSVHAEDDEGRELIALCHALRVFIYRVRVYSDPALQFGVRFDVVKRQCYYQVRVPAFTIGRLAWLAGVVSGTLALVRLSGWI